MRIPYTGPLPPPLKVPKYAGTAAGAVAALQQFLTATKSRSRQSPARTVLLTGAGISVASGLADYRGADGTYTQNKTYRPIYYNEFVASHEARKRYWARSFLGWTNLHRARPNAAHHAVADLGKLGLLSSVITQNVDSFHPKAHPTLKTLELHGFLRSLVCVQCHKHYPRDDFQQRLSVLNPTWAAFLAEMLEAGALDTENPAERRRKGLKTNPDGDVDLPDAPYTTFRYPACPTCLEKPPTLSDGSMSRVETDDDGAWASTSTAGILKPAVIMFGESIPGPVKTAAEDAIDEADRVLVIGSSLATYSAWRLVRRAKERTMPIGILNLGGVRGEEAFFEDLSDVKDGAAAYRSSVRAEEVLPTVVEAIRSSVGQH